MSPADCAVFPDLLHLAAAGVEPSAIDVVILTHMPAACGTISGIGDPDARRAPELTRRMGLKRDQTNEMYDLPLIPGTASLLPSTRN